MRIMLVTISRHERRDPDGGGDRRGAGQPAAALELHYKGGDESGGRKRREGRTEGEEMSLDGRAMCIPMGLTFEFRATFYVQPAGNTVHE